MFGKAFLVAPVLHAQVHSGKYTKLKENEGWDRNNKETAKAPVLTDFTQTKSMEVYLPADTRWYKLLDQ